jgi:ribonucleoside-diphosphate reductase alpha chain
MSAFTQFSQPDAVEAWDAAFRWRQADRLRDVTIEDTWRRVADTAASARPDQAATWTRRYIDAFRRWRLLPEEQLLRALGTDLPIDPLTEPGAVLNVHAFVVRPPYSGAYFDRDSFVATAAVAVHLLDDAAVTLHAAPRPRCLRIGVIGLANALQVLELNSDNASGGQLAAPIAQALAEGCLLGSVELAEAQGSRLTAQECQTRADSLRRRRMPEALVERMLVAGLCHHSLTAIDPHPLLARLANGMADAIDPLPPHRAGVAADRGRAQVNVRDLRADIQPWIDQPIAYTSANSSARESQLGAQSASTPSPIKDTTKREENSP